MVWQIYEQKLDIELTLVGVAQQQQLSVEKGLV